MSSTLLRRILSVALFASIASLTWAPLSAQPNRKNNDNREQMKASGTIKAMKGNMIHFVHPEGRLKNPTKSDQTEDPGFGREIHLRRTTGKCRVTIFEGGHEGIAKAQLEWLAKHKK